MCFLLHPNLEKKIFIYDLPLCRVLMEDEKHYPWFFLVPRREGVSRLIDLSRQDQWILFEEMDTVQRAVWEAFQPDQMNVAAIGNKTPQLHVHVIARFKTDPAWPATVWDHPVRAECGADEKKFRVEQFLSHLLMRNKREVFGEATGLSSEELLPTFVEVQKGR